jgi:hypothetical protein
MNIVLVPGQGARKNLRASSLHPDWHAPDCLLTAASGDPGAPPAINKKHLFARVEALKKAIADHEWHDTMHLIDRALPEQLPGKMGSRSCL